VINASEEQLVAAVERYIAVTDHWFAVTGPQEIAQGIAALSGCEVTENLVRETEVRLRTECADARSATEVALKEMVWEWVGVALP